MKIEFDPRKNLSNQQKHGVSLAESNLFEWDTAVIWRDKTLCQHLSQKPYFRVKKKINK